MRYVRLLIAQEVSPGMTHIYESAYVLEYIRQTPQGSHVLRNPENGDMILTSSDVVDADPPQPESTPG